MAAPAVADPIAECACGCGATWADEGDGRRYATAACRMRALRNRAKSDDDDVLTTVPPYVWEALGQGRRQFHENQRARREAAAQRRRSARDFD